MKHPSRIVVSLAFGLSAACSPGPEGVASEAARAAPKTRPVFEVPIGTSLTVVMARRRARSGIGGRGRAAPPSPTSTPWPTCSPAHSSTPAARSPPSTTRWLAPPPTSVLPGGWARAAGSMAVRRSLASTRRRCSGMSRASPPPKWRGRHPPRWLRCDTARSNGARNGVLRGNRRHRHAPRAHR